MKQVNIAEVFKTLGDTLVDAIKGGSGSGNFGHEGRPGEIGGSGDGGGIGGVKDYEKEYKELRASADEVKQTSEMKKETARNLASLESDPKATPEKLEMARSRHSQAIREHATATSNAKTKESALRRDSETAFVEAEKEYEASKKNRKMPYVEKEKIKEKFMTTRAHYDVARDRAANIGDEIDSYK